ncbi:oligoendopeptidase F [Furfurilactobacillus curtus]|uniref:Oligopeptidase F n=1 Tax=Furfurilactobacillus curtus TaxID=1746200 RepID=A0ABQ5JPQ0_9LACO
MADVKQLPTRDEVPVSLTWDLTAIFLDEAAWEQAYVRVETELTQFDQYHQHLGDGPEQLLAATQALLSVWQHLERIDVYASLLQEQDTSNQAAQGLAARADDLVARAGSALAWFEPEVLTINEDQLRDWLAAPDLAVYQHFFADINRARQHTLPADQESLLSGASDIFNASAKTFGVLDNADLTFPVVRDEEGHEVQLSQGVYGVLLQSTDRSVRAAAFKQLFRVYQQFQNTFASTLSSTIKTHNFTAKVHHYDSARAAALAKNNIPETVYETLVDQVNDHLSLLHRYVSLRKRILGVDHLHAYDLYTPITRTAPLTYTYTTAQKEALAALSVMGPDYVSHVQAAFDQRWIDVVETKGKRSGAFSSGAYDTNPYILLNWQDNLEELFTLVHEMGHSIHSYYTRHNQPYQYGDYAIFVAEIASTTNENTLTQYLLDHHQDPATRAFVLNHYLDGFKGTVFRQTQFAEFEHWLHQEDAAGHPLTAQRLTEYYGALNQRYYGPELTPDPEIAYEWARIPHFYYNYYVFQYATGFAAASTLSQGITSQQPGALERYLTFLKAGNSQYPLSVMKTAGVDMTKPDYLVAAFNVFEQRLNELEAILG